MFDKKIHLLAIAVQDRKKNAAKVNAVLSEYGDDILSRTGMPHTEHDVSLISVFIKAKENRMTKLKQKLQQIPEIRIESLTV